MNVVGIREFDLAKLGSRGMRTAIAGRSAADRYRVLRSLLFACRHRYDDAYVVVSRLVRSEWHRQMGTWSGCDDDVVSLQSFMPWIRARCRDADATHAAGSGNGYADATHAAGSGNGNASGRRTLCVLDDPRTLPHLAAHVASLRMARVGFIVLLPTFLSARRPSTVCSSCKTRASRRASTCTRRANSGGAASTVVSTSRSCCFGTCSTMSSRSTAPWSSTSVRAVCVGFKPSRRLLPCFVSLVLIA